MIYLDHNATTPVLDEVVDAMLPFLREHYGNPSSSHKYGVAARQGVEWAREKVATLIGANPEEIVFTGSGTESNNLAICGWARTAAPGHIVTSRVEHSAVVEPCRRLEKQGWRVSKVGVNQRGLMNLEQLRDTVTEETAFASLMHANNETGVIQPISHVSEITRSHGVILHTDASQSVGKMHVDVNALGVDLMTIAGHKLYAPKGVGALFVREGIDLEPVMVGADHERGLRPGTENVPAIVGLGKACDIATRQLDNRVEHHRMLRERLWERLAEGVPGLKRHGMPDETICNTLSVSFPNVFGEALLISCDSVAASTGSACHEGDGEPSAVLTEMGLSPDEANGSVRLSVGCTTNVEDVDEAANDLINAWRGMQA